jgi:hypothetical protein
MVNPRDAKQLENFLLFQSYPPYDIEWVDCGLKAISEIDSGNKDTWINIPIKGHQLTAIDIAKFLHIDHLLIIDGGGKQTK